MTLPPELLCVVEALAIADADRQYDAATGRPRRMITVRELMEMLSEVDPDAIVLIQAEDVRNSPMRIAEIAMPGWLVRDAYGQPRLATLQPQDANAPRAYAIGP